MTQIALSLGDALPDLPVETDLGAARLHDWRGKTLVVYFYPKDDTPGCTIEGQDFSRLHADFLLAGCQILGVSRDTVASHRRFIAKYDLSVTLAADTDSQLCTAFGVLREKNLYGKNVVGIARSTFLFDATGGLRMAWQGVSIPGHAETVLKAVQSI